MGETPTGPLRRTVDLCVFAPVGVAVSVMEDLPELIAKGRRRVETHLGNALVVGRFVVTRSQQQVASRWDDLWSGTGCARSEPHTGRHVAAGSTGEGAAQGDDTALGEEPAWTGPATAPGVPGTPDPATAAVVAGALADYDTLSASQVVRRLEGLGPDELRAVQRYEASTRHRRTILNRASQLLEERPAGPGTD